MSKVIIYGAGGHAKVIADIFRLKGIEVMGFIDDNPANHDKQVAGIPVLGSESYLDTAQQLGIRNIIVGIGNNKVRCEIANRLKNRGFTLVNAIHPKTVISKSVKMGTGIVIVGGAIINAEAVIGDNVIINSSATIDHECIIFDGAQVSPGVNIAGNTTIGERSYVGIGSSIIEGISVGSDTIIGAGAVVTRDIPSNCTAVGVPAKPIKFHK